MNILVPDAYFWPEKIAFTHLEEDLLKAYVADGHNVTVICPVPTRAVSPEVVEEFKNRFSDEKDGVKIIRFRAPQEGRNPLIRALRYFWCNYKEYQIGKKLTDTDVIFAVSTPPTQGLVASGIKRSLSRKKKKKVPMVYSLQDVFPDSLVNSGLAPRDGILWKIGRKVEDKTYKNSDSIIVISEGIKQNILDKGVTDKKIEVISNWIDFDATNFVERADNKLMDELGIPKDKFIVLYAGNFGETQGADVIADVAKILKDEKDILFVVFGGGPAFKDFRAVAEPLDNLMTFDLQPMERVPEVYSMGDAVMITCKPGTGGASMPSKMWSIMACNRRIIAAFDLDSDLCRLIESLDAGRCVEPGNAKAIADAVMAEKNEKRDSRNNIREKAMAVASKDICTEGYLNVLKKSLRRKKRKGQK